METARRNNRCRGRFESLAQMAVLAGLFWAQAICAMPRCPWPPVPELAVPLYYETFDEDYFAGETNSDLAISGLVLEESWSGYALQRTGEAVVPFIVPALDSSGHTNITSDAGGTLRFWVRPYWSSGAGPGATATLLEFDAVSGAETAYAWSLQVSADGNTLALFTQTGAGVQEALEAAITWQSGISHNVVVNFNSQGTAIFLDGALVAQGAGVAAVPPSVGQLILGSAISGTNTAGADFDEFYSFGRWLTQTDVSLYLDFTASEAALGPISAQEQAQWGQRRRGLAQNTILSPGNVYDSDNATPCSPGGPVYITNLVASMDAYSNVTVSLEIQGGTNGVYYDLYTTANLAGAWTWLFPVLTCNTYVLSNQPPNVAFYALEGPAITAQPTNQTVLVGGTAIFSVAVSGTGPFTFQWQFNGTNLANGIITTVAGNGYAGYSGDSVQATNTSLNCPDGVAVDAYDNLFIADQNNQRIRKVTDSIITTVAGDGDDVLFGYGDGGKAIYASLNYPDGVAVDAYGNLFIADQNDQRIRKVATNGIITTVAGNEYGGYDFGGYCGDGG